MSALSFTSLGRTFELEAAAALHRDLRALFGTFAAATQPADVTWRYELRTEPTPQLRRGGEVIYDAPSARDLPPAVELDIYRRLLDDDDRAVLHGAAVRIAERTVALVGPSGAGKSTLATALVARGAGYVTDEWILIDGAGGVDGVRRPIGLDEPPGDLPPGFRAYVVETPRAEGPDDRRVLLHPPAHLLDDGPRPLGVLVCLSRTGSGPVTARRLEAAEGLALLGVTLLDGGAAPLDAIGELLERVPLYELRRGDIDEACDRVEELAAARG